MVIVNGRHRRFMHCTLKDDVNLQLRGLRVESRDVVGAPEMLINYVPCEIKRSQIPI